ncbi:MarR family transcriptional regulator [Mycobacterium sp. GA-1841]|uniref:MarR family winged helix-turn-helix transcriptional regulator n=1 Tax=Mycobacterium sp. GA-1841 TaxID=1834154 RepID=UPI00096CD91A|nr:MarR family transcriptional regulator [Mycobacterium sp. GA-1841]OMC40188.1 MarR family transcriptional regulator [Mycobacterium sp. GA-1841]
MTTVAGREAENVSGAQIDAVMRASRALVGIAAASVAEVDDLVTLPQLRVLMMIATRGPLNLGAVAAGLDAGAPNASRICDRLLKAGFLHRQDDPNDRRSVTLTLTTEGRAIVNRVNRHRRSAVRKALRGMSVDDRERVTAALDAFAEAAGEPFEPDTLTVV